MNCCPPDSSVHGIFLARNWSGLPFPLPRDPPHPGIKLMSPVSSVLAGRFFTIEPSRQTPVLYVQFSHSVVPDFATPWITARQASLSITNSRSSPKLTPIESMMPSGHLILCCPLLLLPPIRPSIRVFSIESTLHEVAKVLEFQPQHQSFQWIPRAISKT